MTTQPQALIHALYPLGVPAHMLDDPMHPHLDDETIAQQLDESEKHRRRARKSAETRKRKQKEATHD